jgi:hypothetical protein
MFAAMRLASSIVSTFAVSASARVSRPYTRRGTGRRAIASTPAGGMLGGGASTATSVYLPWVMNRLLRFALAVVVCVQPAAVHAQARVTTPPPTNPIPGQTSPGTPGEGNPIPPAQSLAPTPSICGAGGEGLRVCNSDFQSCSSVCAASVFDPNADTSACSARCCSNLVTCLSIRRCNTSGLNCFSLPGSLGITQ